MTSAIDLFAGPGGWDVAARELGIDVIGIEWDEAACTTRAASGLATIRGDVRMFSADMFPASGLIASPPCPTFSTAGKGSGRRALASVIEAAGHLATGGGLFAHAIDDLDDRTGLVLEPLRWALDAHHDGAPYEWIALEQVPTALPVWEAFAGHLRAIGYGAATGILSAEQYGVPQTRRRAFLIARRGEAVELPAPTHSRYYPRDPARLDPDVPPWVSMAEALGWTDGLAVRSNYGSSGSAVHRRLRSGSEPSWTITSKADRMMVTNQRPGGSTEYARRADSRPAPTVTGAARSWRWEYVNGGRADSARRPADRPAPTVRWVYERPATTAQGDPRLGAPGRREFVKDGASMFSGESVRVTVEEAATLQSFPSAHPWQGTKSKQYQQIGNAVPPLLAMHVLKAAS